MQRKYIILKVVLTFSIIGLLALSNLIMASNEEVIDSSDSKSPSLEEMKQEYEELAALGETEFQHRKELINKLLSIISSDKSSSNSISKAMNILGQIRAIEATNKLLDLDSNYGKTLT